MVQNIVAGLVLVALIVIGSISYAQKHHHCEQGYVLKHWRAHALKKTGSEDKAKEFVKALYAQQISAQAADSTSFSPPPRLDPRAAPSASI